MNATANPSTIRMAPRYVIRTIDEDWMDLFDSPSRIEEKRVAWEEAKRRVRQHPELTTVVLDRYSGVTLWRSDPHIPPRYEVVVVDATVFYALESDLPLPGDVLSAHKVKDDAWTAFLRRCRGTGGQRHHRAARHDAGRDHPRVLRRGPLLHRCGVRAVASLRHRRRGPVARAIHSKGPGASLRDRAFSAAISAALRFPLQSLAPPLASLTARSACQERHGAVGGALFPT